MRRVLRDLAHRDLVDVAALDAVRQIDREQTGVSRGAARDRNERGASDRHLKRMRIERL